MDLINYDFESAMEQGFKTLFKTAGIDLYIADDVDGDLPDEHVRIELSVGGVMSNEHLKDSTIYNNYSGAIEIEIQTPRVADDQVALAFGFTSRHAELVATARKAIEEIDERGLCTNWPGRILHQSPWLPSSMFPSRSASWRCFRVVMGPNTSTRPSPSLMPWSSSNIHVM